MSYPFDYKIPDQDDIDFAIKHNKVPYPSQGMTFIKFALVKVSDIKSDFRNPSRERVMVETDIDDIENIIEKKQYSGWGYVPPVINEKGELIAGHHRLEAHKGKDVEYIWVAICKFDDELAELDYNLLENLEEDNFKKKMATNEGCQNALINMWSKGHLTEKMLEERVENLKKKPSDKRIILEYVQKHMGKKIDAHRPISEKQIKSEYTKLTGKTLDTTASISIGDNIVNNQRLLALASKLMNGQDLSMSIKVKDTPNLKELNKERKRIVEELSPVFLYEFCKDYVTKFEDENHEIGKLTLNFPQQYESDKWKTGVKTKTLDI
jgi:hypothetical protein